jgi:uncharacterized membrane protein YvbJ
MFCPYCGRQNQDNVVFCAYCGKALHQKSKSLPVNQTFVEAKPLLKRGSARKVRLSFTAIKAVVTGIFIVGLIIVVLQIYYPGVFPWNW